MTTIGKVVTEYNERRTLPPPPGTLSPQEVEALRDEIADLSSRLYRLEEERDFYKDLLDPPQKRSSLEPPREDGA